MPNQNKIVIKGARVNNLKNITVEIPKNKLVVITGLSGSGKSSLAFDTIFAEGQRRYVESLSSYARQFLELQGKPDVDEIKGLSPTIAIDQRGISENPRSTVATITEIADYLRLLFARVGHPKCLKCKTALSRSSVEEIVRRIKEEMGKARLKILAPLIRLKDSPSAEGLSLSADDLLPRLERAGFTEVRINGEMVPIAQLKNSGLPLPPFTLDVVLGIYGAPELQEDPEHVRMQILTALELGDGTVMAERTDAPTPPTPPSGRGGSEAVSPPFEGGARGGLGSEGVLFFSKDLTCPKCGRIFPPIEPRNFSFNSPHGACPACSGLGIKSVVVPALVLPNPRLTLKEGAIKPWTRVGANQSSRLELLSEVAKKYKFSLDVPVGELTSRASKILLYGTGEETYLLKGVHTKFPGVIPELEARYSSSDSDYVRKEIETYMRQETCPDCLGSRLNETARAVTFENKTIAEICALSVEETLEFLSESANQRISELAKNKKSNSLISNQLIRSLTESELTVASPIIREIITRLENLDRAGLSYLTLDRRAPALSGGEGQRVRLAVQLSTTLSGVIYVLDEPTIGLHERDTAMLLDLLKKLLSLDNTVLVVEHDLKMMREADWIIDMGPGAGSEGGEIVVCGAPQIIANKPTSLTGAYLSGRKRIHAPTPPNLPSGRGGNGAISPPYRGGVRGGGKSIVIKGASAFNLKSIEVKIPLGVFVVVSGVSGSGKSTLILDILARALARKLHNASDLPLPHKEITGMQHLDKVITVDQTPIGRTPRSNPATYTGIFSIIRDLYTSVPEAKLKGFDSGTFSFNVKGGRCEACAGEGYIKVPMQFMAETFLLCNECNGTRYRSEALEIHYQGKNIAEILKMSASEAKKFFSAKSGSASGGKDTSLIYEKLKVLEDVGLGYIRLGQPAPTLSGGEAQRVKLATELSRRATGKTLYILDEPTTGLHFQDIQHLLDVLHRLVEKGNSVIVIEHNLDIIKSADWVLDMGPEGGNKGGEVVAQGTPKDICKVKRSYTGQYLKKL